jgi:hypothetical protein
VKTRFPTVVRPRPSFTIFRDPITGPRAPRRERFDQPNRLSSQLGTTTAVTLWRLWLHVRRSSPTRQLVHRVIAVRGDEIQIMKVSHTSTASCCRAMSDSARVVTPPAVETSDCGLR